VNALVLKENKGDQGRSMNKILAIIVSTAAIAGAAFATGTEPAKKPQMNFGGGKWSIRAFFGFNGGEIKDDGEVDNIYGAGLEYSLPNMGGANPVGGNFSLGVEFNTSSEGFNGLTMQNYGVYGAFAFPLGQSSTMAGLEAVGRVGYFNTRLDNDTLDAEDKWGFGFDLGVRYRVQKMWLELFYRMRPEVDGISNNAITIGVNFPIGN
jgi:long-subunit fatty acid transport protein